MRRRHILFIITFSLIVTGFNKSFAQTENCLYKNQSVKAGEELTYEVAYNWLLIWADVGQVTFTTRSTQILGKPFYKISAIGSTYKSWDLFFKVRDKYESWVDKSTFLPIYFVRDVYEGGFEIDISYVFNRKKGLAYSKHEDSKHPLKKDTIVITPCTYDILSIIYYMRNIDYENAKLDQVFPVNILLDGKIEHSYLRYQGIEEKKIRGLGKFECIKFTVNVIDGSVFKGGEIMTIWVTNDKNKIPVYAETPIIVGSVKIKLIDMKNIRNKLTSKID